MADSSKNKGTVSAMDQARARAEKMAKSGGTPPAQVWRETLDELRKTTWPDRDTLMKSIYVVLAFIAATAVWVGTLNFILDKVMQAILHVSSS